LKRRSAVFTLFNSKPRLSFLWEQLSRSVQKRVGKEFEFIFKREYNENTLESATVWMRAKPEIMQWLTVLLCYWCKHTDGRFAVGRSWLSYFYFQWQNWKEATSTASRSRNVNKYTMPQILQALIDTKMNTIF